MIHSLTIYVLQCAQCARQLMYDGDGLVFYSVRHLRAEAVRQGWWLGNEQHFCEKCGDRTGQARTQQKDEQD